MKTRLLAVVQSERQRANAPAVLAASQRRPNSADKGRHGIGALIRRLRSFLGLANSIYATALHVASIPHALVVLPAEGHKYDEVCQELTEAGLPPNSVGFSLKGSRRGLRACAHWRCVLALANCFLLLFRVLAGRRLRPYLEVLVLTECLSSLLRKRPGPEYWVIIGDLSTFLIALASACGCAGRRVVTWQYSYLDFKRFPVRGDLAVILNDGGRRLARRGPESVDHLGVYWRPGMTIRAVRFDGLERQPAGALLNVFGDAEAIARLSRLHSLLGVPILVRPHPNSRLRHLQWPEGLLPADPEEPLEEFALRIGVAICGNTQAQAKVLGLGVPVVQCAGLDLLPFDHHGYVRDGIVWGIRSVEDFSFSKLRAFYQDLAYLPNLERHFGAGPGERSPGLAELVLAVQGAERAS